MGNRIDRRVSDVLRLTSPVPRLPDARRGDSRPRDAPSMPFGKPLIIPPLSTLLLRVRWVPASGSTWLIASVVKGSAVESRLTGKRCKGLAVPSKGQA